MWQELPAFISLIVTAVILLILIKRVIVRLFVMAQGAFWAPTSDKRIKQINQLAKFKPKMKLADLGAGDGRILIELVKANPGITAVGIELDPKYFKLATENVRKAKLEKKIQIIHGSFWDVDLSKFDVITVYLVQMFMGRLEKKVKKEIKKSCKVISVFFIFPTWKPKKQLGDIRLYQK